jgi:hypothetical protein
VTVTRKGSPEKGSVGAALFDGDVVETAESSNALLLFADGREVELQESGRLEIGRNDDGLLLNVGQGIVVSRIVGTASELGLKLNLDTPYGMIRVGSGGVSVNVSGSEANIDVLAGDVTLVSRQGGSLVLEVGSGGTLTRTAAVRRLTAEPIIINLTQGSGRIELKKKDARAFSVVNPRKAPPLGSGDTLRVSQGSATLAPAQSEARLTMLTGTEVGIGESVKSSGTDDLAFELKKGQMQVVMPYGQKRTLRPGEGLALVADQGAQLSVVRGKNGLELNSIVGDVTVVTESGEKTLVKGGQFATLSSAGAVAKDSLREALILPSRQGLRLLHPGTERAALIWPGAENKPYRVTVGNDASLENPLIDGVVHQPFLNTPIPAKGALFWRVTDGETEVAKGSVFAAPEKIGDDLAGITNEVPAGPEKTVIFFQDKPPALTFTWKAPEKTVSQYLLKVYRAGNLGSAVVERTVASTSVQLPLGAIPEGKYQWDITWLDAAGTPVGTGGKMNPLELQYDNAVRALNIKTPRNGDAPASKVNVTGVAPLGIKVTANGQPLNLDAKARFAGEVAPISGARVVFRATGGGGETIIVRWLGRGGR